MSEAFTEADALKMIEKHKWAVAPQCGGGWVIDGAEWGHDDADVIELARTRGSLLDAVKMAMSNDEAGIVLQRK